jgi:NADH-quinone oxidoreductase subunit L
MTLPLVVLAVFAVGCAWFGVLETWILTAEPAHVAGGVEATSGPVSVSLPGHAAIHAQHHTAGVAALLAAVVGAVLSGLCYWKGLIDPESIRRPLAGVHRFLVQKWQFDHLYDVMFVRPVHVVARWCTSFDRFVLDAFLHRLSRLTVDVANWDRKFDETVVDGLVNVLGDTTFAVGRSLRAVQTGRLRQYVTFIALGVVGLFLLLFVCFPPS